MKKLVLSIAVVSILASCTRVDPNHVGVLMQNFGKNGKGDYTKVYGRVSTISPSTKLFEVPLWEQRAEFLDDEGNKRILHLQAADNTEFTSTPYFSYRVIEGMAVDLVFKNSQLNSGGDFLQSVQSNVLQPRIYEVMKDQSRLYHTDSLMMNSGKQYEERVTEILKKEFETIGIELITFSGYLTFPKKVKDKIDDRNEVDQNILVIKRQIEEQKMRNELAVLKAEEIRIFSESLNPKYLNYKWMEAWKVTKQPIYGEIPLMKEVGR